MRQSSFLFEIPQTLEFNLLESFDISCKYCGCCLAYGWTSFSSSSAQSSSSFSEPLFKNSLSIFYEYKFESKVPWRGSRLDSYQPCKYFCLWDNLGFCLKSSVTFFLFSCSFQDSFIEFPGWRIYDFLCWLKEFTDSMKERFSNFSYNLLYFLVAKSLSSTYYVFALW